MEIDEIYYFAKYLADWFWNAKYDLFVKVNNRLKSTIAWYIQDKGIEVNKEILIQDKYVIADIMAHELLHWYLHSVGQCNDDDSIEFRTELYRNGITPSQVTQSDEHGKLLYEYKRYEYTCDCGSQVQNYAIGENINHISKVMCCKCTKPMKIKHIKSEYGEFIPSWQIRIATDNYFNKRKAG